jgi:hypothetical protein
MNSKSPPVIVGMTTLPSRIGLIRPAIDSLLANTRVPDRIVLTVPRNPLRGGGTLQIPEFLDLPNYAERVVVNVIEEDFGPGSKLLGCLAQITEPSVVILADDDMDYRPFLIEQLAARQAAEHRKSFSFYAYRFSGLTVGQGADGFSMWSDNLPGVERFYADHVRGRRLAFHDDLWISYFLLSRGVAIESLQHLLGGELVYRSVHSEGALRDLEGDLARERIAREGLRGLLASAPLPPRTRLARELRRVAETVASVRQKVARRAARWLS